MESVNWVVVCIVFVRDQRMQTTSLIGYKKG